MSRSLLVKVTAGAEDAERCNQGLTVSATAVAGRAPDLGLEHATPAEDLLEAVRTGGRVTVCTQCARRRDLAADDLMAGVRIAGAQTFVEEALAEGVQALVY